MTMATKKTAPKAKPKKTPPAVRGTPPTVEAKVTPQDSIDAIRAALAIDPIKVGRTITYEQCQELSIEELESMCVSDKERQVAHEYVIDKNKTQAAIRAGFSAHSARSLATPMFAKHYFRSLSEKLIEETVKRASTTADDVLARLGMIAKGDPRELSQWRIRCCRHCWGVDFKYQETPAEHEDRKAKHLEKVAEKVAKSLPEPEWDMKGGPTYDGRKAPNPECPECWGEGEGYLHIPDSRTLSPEGVALFAGVEQGKDGIKAKTLSQEKALEMLAKAHKVFEDKVEVNLGVFTTEELEKRFGEKMRKAHERQGAVREERGGKG